MIGLSQPSKIKLDSKTFVKSQRYVHTFNAFLNVLNEEAQLTEKQSSLVIFKLTLPELIFDREGALAVQGITFHGRELSFFKTLYFVMK